MRAKVKEGEVVLLGVWGRSWRGWGGLSGRCWYERDYDDDDDGDGARCLL